MVVIMKNLKLQRQMSSSSRSSSKWRQQHKKVLRSHPCACTGVRGSAGKGADAKVS
jgi:hypothetical protein